MSAKYCCLDSSCSRPIRAELHGIFGKLKWVRYCKISLIYSVPEQIEFTSGNIRISWYVDSKVLLLGSIGVENTVYNTDKLLLFCCRRSISAKATSKVCMKGSCRNLEVR